MRRRRSLVLLGDSSNHNDGSNDDGNDDNLAHSFHFLSTEFEMGV